VTTEPEVALVFSPETWVEGLHRHLTDHGGARVRQVVMDPAVALEEEYGTIIVSHRWPGLTHAFVEQMHRHRRRILGVFDRSEPAGHDYLQSLAVDRIIESDAPMASFLEALTELSPTETAPPPEALEALLAGNGDEPAAPLSEPRLGRTTVVGGPPGGGATEVAIGLARAVGSRGERVVVVDADEVVPAVAQRLGLPIEPNLRTAVDAVEYRMGRLSASLHRPRSAPFHVLAGLPNVAAWSQVRPSEVVDVLQALTASAAHVIANVSSRLEDLAVGVGRSRYGISRAVVSDADALVGVGLATPVGITRLLAWIADVRALTDCPLHLVVNRSPADAFRRAEIADEIHRTYPPTSLSFVPTDRAVELATWEGDVVAAGPFSRGLADIADVTVRPLQPTARNGARRNGRLRWTRPRLELETQ